MEGGLWAWEALQGTLKMAAEDLDLLEIWARIKFRDVYVGYQTDKFKIPVMPLAVPVTETVRYQLTLFMFDDESQKIRLFLNTSLLVR
jgi:hypothetical protein